MTREEAIKVLDAELKERSDGYYSYLVQYGKQDKAEEEFLDSLGVAISALREQPRWISVEEALPPDQSDVLVVVLWNGEWQTMTGWLSCVTHEWRCVTPYGEHKPEKVTYWMPLPCPEVEV